MVPVLFVVSTSSLMILDQRTLAIKYRVPAADVVRISLSPFLDDIAVFHVKTVRPQVTYFATHPLLPFTLAIPALLNVTCQISRSHPDLHFDVVA